MVCQIPRRLGSPATLSIDIRFRQFEGVFDDVKGGYAFHEKDFDDIETKFDLGMPQQVQPGQRAAGDELLLFTRHRFARSAKLQAAPRLDLNKDKDVARFIAADQIDFAAMRRAKILVEHAVAVAPQMPRGQPFPFPAKPLVRVLVLLRRTGIPFAERGEKTGDESGKGHARAV